MVKASKDRTGLFDKQPEFVISEETGKLLKEWSSNGKDPIKEIEEQLKQLKTRASIEQFWTSEEVKRYHKNNKVITLFTNRSTSINQVTEEEPKHN